MRPKRFRSKISPLEIERGKTARDLRKNGVMRFVFEGKPLDLPLRNENGLLQGLYVIPRGQFKGRLLSFRFSGEYSLGIFLLDGHKELFFDRLGETGFMGTGHRLVPDSIRRMGVATKALNILEPHVARRLNRPKGGQKFKLLSSTTKKDTAALLKSRGYGLPPWSDKESRTQFNKIQPGRTQKSQSMPKLEHMGGFHLLLEKVVNARPHHELSKYHRIEIIGVNGKPKIFYIKVRA